MSILKPPMVVVPIPTSNYGQGIGRASGAVVCHIAECDTISQLDNWFQNPLAGVSANYGVGTDGTIHQYVDSIVASDAAYVHGIINHPDATFTALYNAHNHENPNTWALGIEHVGRSGFNQVTGVGIVHPLTELQFIASVELSAWLCSVCGIDPSNDTILGHYQIDSINRPGCPGWDSAYWTEYIEAVRGALGRT